MMNIINDERLVKKEFWKKIKRSAGKIPFMEDVVSMHFCAIDSKTPITTRITIFGALAYFILPVDAIPDLAPLVGYTDDAGVIATALLTVQTYITDEHRNKAKEWLNGNI